MSKLSNYVIKIPIDDKVYYYNLIDGDFVKENELTAERYSFFIDENKNEFDELIKYNNKLREESDFMCLTLVVTKRCNLKCVYCFEDTNHIKLDISSISIIKDIIEKYKILNSNFKRLVVFWFGGEPLINMDYILEINKALKNITKTLNLQYTSRIITNGYLLDNLIPYINELNLTDIQITLDGTKEVHDKRRKTIDGKGSFDKIIENIKNIDEKVDLIIRTNVDSNNIENIFELYDFLKNININPKVDLYFQPMLVENYGGKSECYMSNMPNNDVLLKRFLELQMYTNTLEKVSFIKAYCNVNFPGSLVVNNDGNIFKCWAAIENEENSKGNLYENCNVLEHMNYEPFDLVNDKCKICTFFPACMGGCKYKKYDVKECLKRKKIIIERIKLLIQNKEKTSEIK
ncbi:TPA: radical SAM protein [Clostridium perfringens]|uniref:Radical SAM protein n=1 Tax=Clostridium perfringens TaxID=1502 RepID=A0A8H9UXJ4_CLOPF|nr:radical SAM protein [Clostridium perfringens]